MGKAKKDIYKTLLFGLILLSNPIVSFSSIQQEIDSLINEMTLEEKVRMTFGGERFGEVIFPGVERLGIPDLRGADGPRGVVIPDVTVFPSGLGYAATWNEELAEQAGHVIGEEARVNNVSVIFGPAFNINRDPLGGRFFEYMSEDPVLSGKMAAAQIRGMQDEDVIACAKHFAVNGRDLNRNLYMTWADERTLREIYLKGFEIAVKESDPWSVMTAANGLNGELCSDNAWLLQQVLKNEWGFSGIVMTDFCHSRSTVKAALAGLDVDMPWGHYEDVPFGEKLKIAVEEGKVPQEIIDDKVRRLLEVRYKIGVMGEKEDRRRKGEKNTPQHQKVALDMARESITLLKNENNILPIDSKKIKNLVVIGPSADRRFDVLGLGGSSGAQSPFEVTVYQGLKNRFGDKAEITCIPLTGEAEFCPIDSGVVSGKIMVEYSDLFGNHKNKKQSNSIDFSWFNESPIPEIKKGDLHAEAITNFKAPKTGLYIFRLSSDDTAELWIEDMGAPTLKNGEHGVPQMGYALVQLEGGKEYPVKVSYRQTPEGAKNSTEMNYWAKENPSLKLEWSMQGDSRSIAQALKPYKSIIKNADYVIFAGGLDHNLDCEGRDRKSMEFPEGQTELIHQISKLNKNIIAVLYHGSPVTLPWLDNVSAVLDLYYPGMFGGEAAAEIIAGEVSPSGKLTFSWPATYEDAPLNIFSSQDFENVYCKEKMNVGYRYYDTHEKDVIFPFGFGLSYSDFDYSNLEINPDITVLSFSITNKGDKTAKETAQVYVSQPQATVSRPIHELKAFKKIELQPGETKTVNIPLNDECFSYFDVATQSWVKDPASFIIQVGSSSRDIRLSQEITL